MSIGPGLHHSIKKRWEAWSDIFSFITILIMVAIILFWIVGFFWQRSNYVCIKEHEEWIFHSNSPDGTPNVFPIKQKMCSQYQLRNQLQQKIKP